MSEGGDSPTPFLRGSRTRASLPVVRSTNQTKEKSLGVLFLQYGDDIKQLRMPNEITSTDTIRALFVSAFPQLLNMKVLESPNVAIYIKDENRNIYYELTDVRSIHDRCLLKVYNKDPAQAFNHTPRPVNGDMRMQREITYTGREGPPLQRTASATHPYAAPNSPPTTPISHSMPASPSRIPYGGARPLSGQGNVAVPKERLSNMPPIRSISPSPSAILERRDVKPDEDLSNKNIQLLRNEGIYADPYMFHEGRMSVASSHTGHPMDMPDHIFPYHRGAMRSSSTYSNSSVQSEMMEQSMYRQKSRKYSESHLPSLGSKTPPSSPHRVTDIRLVEHHVHNAHVPPHAIQSDRSSPIRQSFKKESGPPLYMEATMAKARNAVGLQGMVDVGPSANDKQTVIGYGSAAPPKEAYTRERMQAMEKQIASLTGLVQSALFKGPAPMTAMDSTSEKMTKTASNALSSAESGGTSYVTGGKNTLGLIESAMLVNHVPPSGSVAGHANLHDMRRSISDLRLQLHRMRQLQLQNQDMLRAMVKKAELEINSRVIETVKRLEDPVQRQRVLVEQERQNYLHEEETLVKKISDLEGFVDDLKKDSASVNKGVTLKDVEDGAFSLRQIGEAVANLKGAFPPLQNKMRAVLRVEVEAVRFLKEEPHKLDSLLKRIRNMTDVLTALRRHVTDYKEVDSAHKVQYTVKERSSDAETLRTHDEVTRTQSFSQQTAPGAIPDPKASSLKSEPFSTMTIHHVQSSPVFMHPSQHSSALLSNPLNSPATTHSSVGLVASGEQFPSTPGTPQESVAVMQQTQTAQSPPVSVNGSSTQSFFINQVHHAAFKNRVVSIEEAEKKWEEKRQNLDYYNGKEFEKLLDEAQANIMKSIPSLEMPPQSPKTEAVETLEVFEEATDHEHEKILKSPPPPPPRRIYPPGSGISSTRAADVMQTITKEPDEDASPTLQSKISRSQCDDQSSQPSTPVVADSITKEDDEQEGERIMAELQKYSFTDVNSKGLTVQSRIDSQIKEMRPVGLMHPKEKKNLDFSKEEVKKYDDAYEKTSTTECSRVAYYVTARMEHTPDAVENVQDKCQEQGGRPRESEPQTMAEKTVVSLTHKHSPLDKDVAKTEEGSKIVNAVRESPSAGNCSVDTLESREQQTTFRVQSPVFENVKVEYTHRADSPAEIEKMESTNKVQSPLENEKLESTYRTQSPVQSEKVRINYRVSSVVSESTSPNELTIVDGFTKISDDASPDKNDNDSSMDCPLTAKTLREHELPVLDSSQQVVLRPKVSKNRNVHVNEDTSSPSTSPTDHIAFMITQNEVQVLSSGEVRDIVSKKGDDIQTVNIDARADKNNERRSSANGGKEDPVLCMDKKPVIIIFDEPMDIRSAYKRLSTIFEDCEEEFDRMMSGQKIIEEEEDEDLEMSSTCEISSEKNLDVRFDVNNRSKIKYKLANPLKSLDREEEETSRKHLTDSDDINSGIALDSPDYQYANRDDVKKKFKFKFPKKQLAALTQAIRTGSKTGKKTLQVVVYEDEEEPDGTVKQHKEAKRFEISRSKSKEEAARVTSTKQHQLPETTFLPAKTDEIRKNTYKTLDSLEQTIKQLENTISEMSPKGISEIVRTSEEDCSLPPTSPVQINNTSKQGELKTRCESPSSIPSAPRKVSSGPSQTSRMPVPMASKSRQQGSVEKTSKQPKLQEPQRQYRQANGGTKKAGGDFKSASPTLTSSKIPAYSATSVKGSSLPPYCGESHTALSPPTKSPISSANPLSPQTGRTINSSSLIPSIPNGASKTPNNAYPGKSHHLSFSPQAANGRPSPSSSSSSPSTPTSPLSLGQGMKNIRTIHTPSLTSYKSQNGNARKVTTATAKEPS